MGSLTFAVSTRHAPSSLGGLTSRSSSSACNSSEGDGRLAFPGNAAQAVPLARKGLPEGPVAFGQAAESVSTRSARGTRKGCPLGIFCGQSRIDSPQTRNSPPAPSGSHAPCRTQTLGSMPTFAIWLCLGTGLGFVISCPLGSSTATEQRDTCACRRSGSRAEKLLCRESGTALSETAVVLRPSEPTASVHDRTPTGLVRSPPRKSGDGSGSVLTGLTDALGNSVWAHASGVAGVGRKLAGGDRPVFVADGVAACHMDPDRELKR